MVKERTCPKCGKKMALVDCNGIVDVYECTNKHSVTEDCNDEQRKVAIADRNERFMQLIRQLNDNKDVIVGTGQYFIEVFFKADCVVLENEMKALHDMLHPYDIHMEVVGRSAIRIYNP